MEQTVKAVVLCICLNLVVGDVLRYGFEYNKLDSGNGKHWAVIVAGSNGWYNYRHQVNFGVYKILNPFSLKWYRLCMSIFVHMTLNM